MRRVYAYPYFLFTELALSLAGAVGFTVTAVYFVRDVGMSPLQLVLVGTVMEAAIFVFEIPTGVFADTVGRRASLILGWSVMGSAMILVGTIDSVPTVLAGYALWGFGHTFTSGAYEAWITDEVGVERVGRVFARGAQVSYAGALAGIGLSVVLAASLGLGFAVAAGGALTVGVALVSLALMPETGHRRTTGEPRPTWRDALATAESGARLVRGQPILLLIVAITFFAGMSTESFDRLWEAHFLVNVGLPAIGSLDPVYWFGIFGVGSLVLSLVATQVLVKRFERRPEALLARTLLVLTVVQAVSVAIFGLATSLVVAMAGLWLYRLTRSLVNPVYMTWLNQNIADSRVRATVISIAGQSDAIGQVGGGPLLGAVGNVFGIRAALLAGAAALVPALSLYGRAVAHGGREPELEHLPEAPEAQAG